MNLSPCVGNILQSLNPGWFQPSDCLREGGHLLGWLWSMASPLQPLREVVPLHPRVSDEKALPRSTGHAWLPV